MLKTLGFSITFLCSQKYVLNKLSSLNTREPSTIKTSFSEDKHPRFMKEFSFHDPCGRSKLYKNALETADLEKHTKLISICAMLLQTKVYLFGRSARAKRIVQLENSRRAEVMKILESMV